MYGKGNITQFDVVEEENKIGVVCTCPDCGAERALILPLDAFKRWIDNTPIQDALPDLLPDDREALMTGLCSECWEKHFS